MASLKRRTPDGYKDDIYDSSSEPPHETITDGIKTRLDANAFRCWACDQEKKFIELSIDHQVPISRGGANVRSNVSFVCRRCNQTKGDLTYDEYRQLDYVLAGWADVAKNSVRSRLRFGGRMFWRKKA